MHKRFHTRCKGTGGFELANGNVVPCASCCGRGFLIIYTAAEKAERKAAWDRRYATLDIIKRRAAEISEGEPRGFADVVRQGFGMLADREPERLERLYASLDAGRLDDVIRALVAYRRSQG